MIVECINDNWDQYKRVGEQSFYDGPFPIKGNYYHVIGEHDVSGKRYYELFEIQSQFGKALWNVEHFRELDIDISSIEIEKEEPALI